MLQRAVFLAVGLSAAATAYKVVPQWEGTTVQHLHREYGNIFRHGNRNAASHLWSSFILDRSRQMTRERFELMFSGFCAVSGSPVGPNDYNRYRLTLQTVTGAKRTGFMHYCCWPCVCDTQDFLKVDTLNVTLAGQRTVRMHFVVEGNPCDHPEQLDVPFVHPFNYGGGETTIRRDAPEVRCGSGGELLGATLSDHGYPIISLFFDAPGAAGRPTTLVDRPTPGRATTSGGVIFQDEQEYSGECASRAAAGYNSGMGEIFRKVAAVSPIVPGRRAVPAVAKGLLAQRHYSEAELNAERSGFLKRVIRDYAGACVGCQEKRHFVAKILALQAGEGRSLEEQALSGDGRVPSRAAHKGMLAQLNYTEAELSKQRVASLKRILRDHGASCVGCNEKAEFVAKVLSVQREACAAK